MKLILLAALALVACVDQPAPLPACPTGKPVLCKGTTGNCMDNGSACQEEVSVIAQCGEAPQQPDYAVATTGNTVSMETAQWQGLQAWMTATAAWSLCITNAHE
jgi:hypothetical protein